MTRCFVYGTLKKGKGNCRRLENAIFVGDAETLEQYTMISLGYFPGVLLKEPTHKIQGEVYEIDEEIEKSLDSLEGYPNFYNKKLIQTTLGEAIMYYLPTKSYINREVVEGGRW